MMLVAQRQNLWSWYPVCFARPFTYSLQRRYGHRTTQEYGPYFALLGLQEGCDQADARNAFLNLAKKYHPDSGHALSDAAKFHQIEKAYRKVLEKFNRERKEDSSCEGEFGLYYDPNRRSPVAEEDEEGKRGRFYDLKHTAPQHRQYLNNEGIGMGGPAQREKQFQRFKALRASEHVVDYKIQKLGMGNEEDALVVKDKIAAKKFKTRYGIERVVEDMILDSMAKGDFDNLPNAGKPLQYQNYNPYVDVVTHKLNEVLINNGYAPGWVLLEKDIRKEQEDIREILAKERSRLGPLPLSSREEDSWNKTLEKLQEEVAAVNKKIDNYNLVVPILSKQMFHFPLTREAEKALLYGRCRMAKSNPSQSGSSNKGETVSSTDEKSSCSNANDSAADATQIFGSSSTSKKGFRLNNLFKFL